MINKYYSEKQIYMSAFFGGPIPPGILIFKNLKNIGENKQAVFSLIITFIFTILLFFGLMQLPESIFSRVPNTVFTALYTVIIFVVYHYFLADKINNRIVDLENKVSNWNVAGLTVMGLIINLIIIFSLASIQPAFTGEKQTYGEQEHEVFYDSNDFTREEINKIGSVLYEFGYFQADFKQSVRIEIIGGNSKLRLPVHISQFDDHEIMSRLVQLKANLSSALSSEVIIVVKSYKYNGDMVTKEI